MNHNFNSCPPRMLYKYRTFTLTNLEAIIYDKIYFADPRTFNDPMDTRPSLEVDIDIDELREIFVLLFADRTEKEIHSTFSRLKHEPSNIDSDIKKILLKNLQDTVDVIYSDSWDEETDQASEDNEIFILSQYIEEELQQRYKKGIFSMASRYDCPLMWSHYGDLHRGLCLGYSIPADVGENVKKVDYGGDRLVKASCVKAMLEGDLDAQAAVDDAVLLRKAPDWSYEKEWRYIGSQGLKYSSIYLQEIMFGTQCPAFTKYILSKSMEERDKPICFYEMRETKNTFTLERKALEDDELDFNLPNCHQSTLEWIREARLKYVQKEKS